MTTETAPRTRGEALAQLFRLLESLGTVKGTSVQAAVLCVPRSIFEQVDGEEELHEGDRHFWVRKIRIEDGYPYMDLNVHCTEPPATQKCRGCGTAFEYDPEADFCPGCAAENRGDTEEVA